jgi:hypothetical protein
MPAEKGVSSFCKIGNTAGGVSFLFKERDLFPNLILAFESKREGADVDANELAGKQDFVRSQENTAIWQIIRFVSLKLSSRLAINPRSTHRGP